MSGRRQHHIPRFLQKGFFSRKMKKQYYTWVFKKDRQPYECNLVNVGLEIDFYGKPTESEADNNITNSEEKYADFIETLRLNTTNIALDPIDCASLIGHMHIRAKGTRKSIYEIGEAFLSGAKEKLEKIESPELIVKHLIKTQRKEVAKKIKENLPHHLSDEQKFLLTKYCLDNPKEWISKLSPSSWQQFLIHFGFFIENLPNLIKDSHNQTLETTSEAKGFLKTCGGFNWQLLYSPEANIILGDIGAIGQFSPEGEYRNLMFIKENLINLFLPISSKHLLYGAKNNDEVSTLPINEINKAIATLSREFFISSINDDKTTRLSDFLGNKSAIVGENEKIILEEKLRDVIPN